jgi:hypothetical protein
MKIVCVSASQVPSDTANSIQVMKVCQAFTQLGHNVTLLVPGPQPKMVDLLVHYGLQTPFTIEWLPTRNRHQFPWKAVWQARRLVVYLANPGRCAQSAFWNGFHAGDA